MKRLPQVRPNLLDRVVTWMDPAAGLRRMQSRTMLAMAGGYTGARRDRRATENWQTSAGSADADLEPDRAELIRRSRDLDRNNPIARGALNTNVNNVVGTGLFVQSRIDRAVLGPLFGNDDDRMDEVERAFEREYYLWGSSADCDFTRVQPIVDQQSMAFRSALASGDIFLLRRYRERPNRRLGLCIQAIEADRVANPSFRRDTPELTGGIYKDADGAVVACNVLNDHPGNPQGKWSGEGVRVPYFDAAGGRLVLHLYDRMRPDQTRGEPYLAPVIELIKQLGRYTDAEVMAAVISGMFTVFVKTEGGEGLPHVGGGAKKTGDKMDLGNGAIIDLMPGESIDTANPGRPNAAFDPFVLSILRQIGVALSLPFEMLVLHFTASYSAAQAALLLAWKWFLNRREWLARGMCQPIYEWVITEAVARGLVAAPGFAADPMLRAAYLGTSWIGPPRGSIDPVKEAEAAKRWHALRVKSLDDIVSEATGGDWESTLRQQAKEAKVARALGLPEVADESPAPLPALPPAPDNEE